jgi:hypothetical protein
VGGRGDCLYLALPHETRGSVRETAAVSYVTEDGPKVDSDLEDGFGRLNIDGRDEAVSYNPYAGMS